MRSRNGEGRGGWGWGNIAQELRTEQKSFKKEILAKVRRSITACLLVVTKTLAVQRVAVSYP